MILTSAVEAWNKYFSRCVCVASVHTREMQKRAQANGNFSISCVGAYACDCVCVMVVHKYVCQSRSQGGREERHWERGWCVCLCFSALHLPLCFRRTCEPDYSVLKFARTCGINTMFFRVWQLLHIFLRLGSVTIFPAFGTCCMFSRVQLR